MIMNSSLVIPPLKVCDYNNSLLLFMLYDISNGQCVTCTSTLLHVHIIISPNSVLGIIMAFIIGLWFDISLLL